MPLIKTCLNCGNKFSIKPYWVKIGGGKHCSRKCRDEAFKTGKIIVCFTCGKNVYKQLRALKHSKSKKYFCNKSCQTIWRNSVLYIGKNHPNWKYGEYTYRKNILKSTKVPICILCKIKDLRVLAVHHIDRNRKNNGIDNLAWLCNNCHVLVHHYSEEREKFTEALV